jgi:hypothetical protein
MTSKRMAATDLQGFATIDCEVDFCIRYDEPVCFKCKSMLIRHRFEKHFWKFSCAICGSEIGKQVMMLLDRVNKKGKRNEIRF